MDAERGARTDGGRSWLVTPGEQVVRHRAIRRPGAFVALHELMLPHQTSATGQTNPAGWLPIDRCRLWPDRIAGQAPAPPQLVYTAPRGVRRCGSVAIRRSRHRRGCRRPAPSTTGDCRRVRSSVVWMRSSRPAPGACPGGDDRFFVFARGVGFHPRDWSAVRLVRSHSRRASTSGATARSVARSVAICRRHGGRQRRSILPSLRFVAESPCLVAPSTADPLLPMPIASAGKARTPSLAAVLDLAALPDLRQRAADVVSRSWCGRNAGRRTSPSRSCGVRSCPGGPLVSHLLSTSAGRR